MSGDPGAGDGLVESAPPAEAVPPSVLQLRRTQAPAPARRTAARRVSVAAAPAARSGWWPSWLRWPSRGSSAGIVVEDSRYYNGAQGGVGTAGGRGAAVAGGGAAAAAGGGGRGGEGSGHGSGHR